MLPLIFVFRNKKFNVKGKLAAGLAGVLTAGSVVPTIVSFLPETVSAATQVLYKNTDDPGEKRAGTSSRQNYNGNDMTVVRSAHQLELAIATAVSKGWTAADKELVIFVDNSVETIYDDGSYDNSSTELNCFIMDRTIEIPSNANIKLVSTAENNVKFVRSSDYSGSDSMFRVKGTLTVADNITMSGELASKTGDVAAVTGQQKCSDGKEPGPVIEYTEYVDIKANNGNYSVNGYIYNSEGKVLAGAADFGTEYYRSENYPKAAWVDPDDYTGEDEKKITWYSKQKTANVDGVIKTLNYLVNDNSWVLVTKQDCSILMLAPEWELRFFSNQGEYKATVYNDSYPKAHAEVSGGKLKMGYYQGDGLMESNVFNAVKQRVDHYYPEDRCSDGTLPKDATSGHPSGKKYGNSTAHTWKKSSDADGNYLNNNTGFFISQESGNLIIDGATFKDFETISGENTYDYQPLGSAPIYVAGGKFVMNSGNIVNNTVGYTIGDDEWSGQEAQKIKSHIETKPETYTAGAIIFAGGTDHELNGGNIFGNRADSGAIIVKTRNNHPFAKASFDEHMKELVPWAKNNATGELTTKVTMGANSSTGPVIAGNVGIHDSGAIFIWPVGDNDTAEVTMNAGTIKDNFSWYKGGAFNVCSEIDPIEHWTRDQKRPNAKAVLDMNGGLIENNTAVSRSGAIEVLSDQVYLNAGVLRDNNSRTLGGAIYVEGDFADRLYTLYLPNTFVNDNYAWRETKAGREADDYAYLKRKLVSENRAKQNTDGTYTYDNPLGNVRDADGKINDTETNAGKKDWTPVESGDKKWIISGTRTGDWAAYSNMGLGGGLWLCAVGGYASINFLDTHAKDDNPNHVGAIIDGNHGTKGNGSIDWDITALGRDGGFILSNLDDDPKDSEYVYLDDQNKHLVWNKLYSGYGGRYDIVNSYTKSDNTNGGKNGVLIQHNNARVGGGIAANGTVVFGKNGNIYRHSAETTFTKTWNGVAAKPMAFQAYIIKADGTKVAIPGYQFILDGTVGGAQGSNGTPQSVVDETSAWTAKIQLPYGYDGTPTFRMKVNGIEYDTLDTLWHTITEGGEEKDVTRWDMDIPNSETEGTITKWNFAVEEIPSEKYKKTGLSTGSKYFLIKKVDEVSGTEYDRDPNFKDANGYIAPIDISAQTERPYTNFQSALASGLYFVREYSNVTEINETLFKGKYIILDENGNVVENWFTINNGESEFDSHNLVEKPEKVKLSQTVKDVDYKDKSGNTLSTIREYSIKAETEGNDNLKMENRGRTEAEVEKYIDKKVDKDLNKINQKFTYDIIARVPDQAEEFVISDTLVDWIKYVGDSDSIGIKVLDNNDHLGNGQGTVATGKVNEKNVVNDNLTNQIKNKCEKIIFNDTLTVRVTDKELLKALTGKYVQITVKAEIDSDYYDDVISKISEEVKEVTYSEGNTGTYKLRNEFDKDKYIYRLYKVGDSEPSGMSRYKSPTGAYLSDSELKALGISSGQPLARTGRLGRDGSPIAGFVEEDKTFYNLSQGKYVLHVMDMEKSESSGHKGDDRTADESREWTVPGLCEVFEIVDGKEDIRWVSVAGNSQDSLPEAFKNDSPYMGTQQTAPQVITGDFAKDNSYKLEEFDTDKYIYRLYKVVEDNVIPEGMSDYGASVDRLSDNEIKALGISSGQKLARTGRLGIASEWRYQAGFVKDDKTFYNLSPGKYVLHVMDMEKSESSGHKGDDQSAKESREWTVEEKCIVFELGATDTSDDPLHDGIGNRATYSVTYRGGRQQTLKTNTVTVEPIPGELEFTKIWDGDGAAVPNPESNEDADKEIVDAFKSALTLKLDGETVKDPGFYIEKTEDDNKWKIKTKKLPVYADKTYTLSEDMTKLTGEDASEAVKNFFKYYTSSYSSSAEGSYEIKDFDPEKYEYRIAKANKSESDKNSIFKEYVNEEHVNFEGCPILYDNGYVRTDEITTVNQLEEIISKLPTGDYVLSVQYKTGNKAPKVVAEKVETFHHIAPESYETQIAEKLVDKYGNTKLHDSVITISENDNRKIIAGIDQGEGQGWYDISPANTERTDSDKGDYNYILEKYGHETLYKNESYWGINAKVTVDLNTLPAGSYFDIKWNSGWIDNARRKYTVIGSDKLENVTYSIYKKGREDVSTLGDKLGSEYKYANGLAYEATDAQKGYGEYKTGVKASDLTSAIKEDGDYVIVAENNAERPVEISLQKKYSAVVNGGTIRNTRKLFKVVIRKIDSANKDLPGAAFTLAAADSPDDTIALDNDGAYFASGVVLEPGKEYVIKEQNAPLGYTGVQPFTFKLNDKGEVIDLQKGKDEDTITVEDSKKFLINVKNTTDTTEVVVTKNWDDNDNERGNRPNSITIYLDSDAEQAGNYKYYGTYTVTEDENWSCRIDNLPKYVTYKDGDTNRQRLIKYRIREANVQGYVNTESTIGYEDEDIVDGRVYKGYTTDNVASRYKVGTYTRQVTGSKKHTLKYDNDKKSVEAYCLNMDVSDPDSVDYIKIKISKDNREELATYINVDHNRSKYVISDNIANVLTYGNEDVDTLYYRLLKIAHYGYPNDASGFRDKYGISDDALRVLTANAIYEYTDWYKKVDGVDYTDKANHLFALENTKGVYTTDQLQLKKVGLQDVYRAFMDIVMTNDFSMVENKQLYVYTPGKNSNGKYQYQNLFGVGELANRATLTNKRLTDLIIRKVDEEGNAIVAKGDKKAEFVIVEADSAEEAKTKAYSDEVENKYKSEVVDNNDNAYRFNGIKAGTYWLVETKAPQYYTIGEPVQIVVTTEKRTVHSTSTTTVKKIKALSYKSGERNVEMKSGYEFDSLEQAQSNYQVWTVDNNMRLTQKVDNVDRVLTFAEIEEDREYRYDLHAPKLNGEDEGGYRYSQYTGTPSHTPGWTFNGGKLYQIKPYYRVNATVYVTDTTRTVDVNKFTLTGTQNSSDALTVKLQEWNGSKWTDSAKLEKGHSYRIYVDDGEENISSGSDVTVSGFKVEIKNSGDLGTSVILPSNSYEGYSVSRGVDATTAKDGEATVNISAYSINAGKTSPTNNNGYTHAAFGSDALNKLIANDKKDAYEKLLPLIYFGYGGPGYDSLMDEMQKLKGTGTKVQNNVVDNKIDDDDWSGKAYYATQAAIWDYTDAGWDEDQDLLALVDWKSNQNNKQVFRDLLKGKTYADVKKHIAETASLTNKTPTFNVLKAESADDMNMIFAGLQATDGNNYQLSYINELTKVELPDTGGIGTKWLYILGAAAVAGTIIAIVARNKRKKKHVDVA